MADLFKILLAEKLGHCDSLYESVIGKKLGGYSWQSDYETTPYLYRAMPNLSHYYNREIMEEVVGASAGWNQLLSDGDFANIGAWRGSGADLTVANNEGTLTCQGTRGSVEMYRGSLGLAVGHKFILTHSFKSSIPLKRVRLGGFASHYVDASFSANTWYRFDFVDTVTQNQILDLYYYAQDTFVAGDTVNVRPTQLTDLTLALGSTVADYVYSLEQSTAGSGVAWLKEHFPRMFGQYNPYDAGSIQSVSGLVSHTTKDANDNVIGSYPLDSTLTLRGIPKLDNGKLYYDGDEYKSDGTVTRKYGIVDLGTLNWSAGLTNFNTQSLMGVIKPPASNAIAPTILISQKTYKPVSSNADSGVANTYEFIVSQAGNLLWRYPSDGISSGAEFATAMDGVYLVYEKQAPTTETAQPFTKTQLCDSGGTEEFVTSGIVSVGHKSKYAEK